MSDATYQPKVYRKQGGDMLVIAAGGSILAEPGGSIMAGNPTGAADYFVDLNVSATGSGSMQDPFATIAEAITASNTSIGLTANRWWARRNRIWVVGDGIEEDLTVLPEKCDIIGCGSDLVPYPRVIGHHIIALAKVGCRFINMGFIDDATSDLFVIPAGCHGLQFLGGQMVPNVAGSTKALEITSSAHVVIAGVEIVTNAGNHTAGIFAQAISLEGTAGSHQTRIEDCPLIRGTEGIAIASDCLAANTVIARNLIHATVLTVNDDSNLAYVIDNRLITDVDTDSDPASGIDCKEEYAAGNILTGSGTEGNADTFPWARIAT